MPASSLTTSVMSPTRPAALSSALTPQAPSSLVRNVRLARTDIGVHGKRARARWHIAAFLGGFACALHPSPCLTCTPDPVTGPDLAISAVSTTTPEPSAQAQSRRMRCADRSCPIPSLTPPQAVRLRRSERCPLEKVAGGTGPDGGSGWCRRPSRISPKQLAGRAVGPPAEARQ
jgi:hypothetical protein